MSVHVKWICSSCGERNARAQIICKICHKRRWEQLGLDALKAHELQRILLYLDWARVPALNQPEDYTVQ